MRRNWTRRRFLAAAAAGSALATGAGRSVGSAPTSPGTALSAGSLPAVRAAMDAIVPASEAMPSAGEAGVAAYLEAVAAKDPDVRRQLRKAAASLDRRAGGRFATLDAAARARALAALEREEPPVFEALRDLVYEGYYTRPEVWRRLGFTFYGPDAAGPGTGTFDEGAVARVKARRPFFRKAT